MTFQNLNEQQRKAVTAPLGPVLVLAGAGSGKTRVLTNRILYLVGELGVAPENILAITFTNKAANEMKSRLTDFHCHAEWMHISTIHSFCASVLRREAEQLNKRGNFTIYTEDDKQSVLKKIVGEQMEQADKDVVDEFSELLSKLKNDAADVLENAARLSEDKEENLPVMDADLLESFDRISAGGEFSESRFYKILSEYDKKMTENNALDFDDLLYFVHKLFRTCPQVLQRYQDQYRFICIDEFQDTNKVQYEIFRMLAEKHRNIFVVGDDDQSIYGWRGAQAANLLKFERDFEGAHLYKLEQNYRSTKRILDVANEIICKNGGRYDKTLWTENEEGVKVQLFKSYNEQDEAYFVTQQIVGLRDLGYKFADCAVLMRINALSRTFEQSFLRQGIPYRVFGGFRFFERKEVKDALSYVRLLVNPYDAEAFNRAVNVPVRRGIGDATLRKLAELSAEYGIPLIDVISDERNLMTLSAAARRKLCDFYALYAQLSALEREYPFARFMHEMLDMLSFRQVYLQMDAEERAMNIDELEQAALEFQASSPEGRAADFLQTVSLDMSRGEEDDGDFVTVATIHAVKGLEFKAVFVVGLEDGVFPSAKSTYDAERMREERRLMYVAATRAQKRLYLTCAGARYLYGRTKGTLPSKFFNEIYRYLQAPEGTAPRENDRVRPTVPRPSGEGKSKEQLAAFKAGQMVFHDTFGTGMILLYNDGIAEVVFEKVGKKTLNVRFAPLKIL